MREVETGGSWTALGLCEGTSDDTAEFGHHLILEPLPSGGGGSHGSASSGLGNKVSVN